MMAGCTTLPRHLVAVFTFGLIGASLSTETAAQSEANASASDYLIEEIIVTGTRIKKRDYTSISPISTIDNSILRLTPFSLLEETLNSYPQFVPSYGKSANNPGNGTGEINLRGMGADRTLVLLNGRRLGPSRTGSAIDANNIPQAMIERIEIVTGGASAVYGSDAIAGAVNIITKPSFDGLALDIKYGLSEKADSHDRDYSASFGHTFGSNRGGLIIFGNYHDRAPTFASARSFTAIPIIDNWDGTTRTGGSTVLPGGRLLFPRIDLGNGPTLVQFDANGNPAAFNPATDLYNFATLNYIQLPLKRYAGGLFADYEIEESIRFYFEGTYAENNVAQNLAAVPTFERWQINLDNPTLTAATRQLLTDNYAVAPNLALMPLARRFTDLGPRLNQIKSKNWRVLLGIDGDISAKWSFDAWYIYTNNKETDQVTNSVSRSRIQQGLIIDPVSGQCADASGGCVPVNLLGIGNLSSAAATYITVTGIENLTERTTQYASAYVTGSPYQFDGGNFDIALGLDWRNDKIRYIADPTLATGDALGFPPSTNITGTENAIEAYGEGFLEFHLDQPFAQSLGFEFGTRYSSFDLAGEFTTFKLGGEWRISERLKFRGMLQRSIATPRLSELFSEQATSPSIITPQSTGQDPCSASVNPANSGFSQICQVQGLTAAQIGVFEATQFYPSTVRTGGNPNLRPEKANTLTIGTIFSPKTTSNLVVSIDYYKLDLKDQIGTADSLTYCFQQTDPLNGFCQNITRDATGNISNIDNLAFNMGRIQTEGIDAQLTYGFDLPNALALFNNAANLDIALYWSYMFKHTFQVAPNQPVTECAGFFGRPCNVAPAFGALPKHKITMKLQYFSGKFASGVSFRTIGNSQNAAIKTAPSQGIPNPVFAAPNAGVEHYIDLTSSYAFTERISAQLGITNLLNNQPPLLADAVRQNNTDSNLYDVFGRSYYFTLRANF